VSGAKSFTDVSSAPVEGGCGFGRRFAEWEGGCGYVVGGCVFVAIVGCQYGVLVTVFLSFGKWHVAFGFWYVHYDCEA